MARLLLVFLVGCAAQPRPVARVETPEPVVGDLKCAAPRMSVIEALYRDMRSDVPVRCEPREL